MRLTKDCLTAFTLKECFPQVFCSSRYFVLQGFFSAGIFVGSDFILAVIFFAGIFFAGIFLAVIFSAGIFVAGIFAAGISPVSRLAMLSRCYKSKSRYSWGHFLKVA